MHQQPSAPQLHVVCDARGRWRVFEEAASTPLSEHSTATDAELAAWRHFQTRGAGAIVVHDRYGRTRRPIAYGRSTAAAPLARR